MARPSLLFRTFWLGGRACHRGSGSGGRKRRFGHSECSCQSGSGFAGGGGMFEPNLFEANFFSIPESKARGNYTEHHQPKGANWNMPGGGMSRCPASNEGRYVGVIEA